MALDVITRRPRNAETPSRSLLLPITPAGSFFIRNHFDEPDFDPGSYRLRVGGETQRPAEYTLTQLKRFPYHRVTSVLECAGNGRSHIVPRPEGVPWGDKAVGCAIWEGPRLADVLWHSPPKPEVVEAIFIGADRGMEGSREERFERSIPIGVARDSGPILALRMNGAPLPQSHGAPVRLLVPGWYGMASVKWLLEIKYASVPFVGFFQHEQYVYDDGAPVGAVRPKTLLLRPQSGRPVAAGRVRLEGRAWGGFGGIAGVLAQVDGGPWLPCELDRSEGPWAWRRWSHVAVMDPGRHRVRVRACDLTGVSQPLDPVVNRLGYGYNTVFAVEIIVRSPRKRPPSPTSASRRAR